MTLASDNIHRLKCGATTFADRNASLPPRPSRRKLEPRLTTLVLDDHEADINELFVLGVLPSEAFS